MNKTRILLIMCLGLIMLGSIPAVFGAPTTLDILWDSYGGNVGVDFYSGDDTLMNFYTEGNHIMGELYARDNDDNPYSYNVDSFLTNLDARVEDGGLITYGVDRLDSYEGMYGDPVQSTFSRVTVGTGGWASLAFQTSTNYASLVSGNYGFQANDQFTAGGVYTAYHEIENGNNIAYFDAFGDGEIYVDHMTDTTWGETSINFARGGGCYTNANVDQTGSGGFMIAGHFDNSLTWGGMTSTGSTDFSTSVLFGNGFSWTDYSLSGN